MVFHVLNRGVGRMRLFLEDADFEAFERNIERTLESRPMRICAYCLMSNRTLCSVAEKQNSYPLAWLSPSE